MRNQGPNVNGPESPPQSHHGRGFLAAPLLLALLVSACATPLPEPTKVVPATPEADQAESLPAPPPLLPPPAPDADRLLGLEPRHIQDALGTPSLVRREGAAQVMQFKNGNCVLDIFFYEEAPGGAFLARHLASRLLDGAPITPGDCLAAILPDGRFPPGTLVGSLPEIPGEADAEADEETAVPTSEN